MTKRKSKSEEEAPVKTTKKEEKPNPSSFEAAALKSLGRDFFAQECRDLAKKLLGKIMVRKLSSETILAGRIVETEAYLGAEDKASHSYKGKKTKRNAAMFASPGTSYVYNIYGMYQCFNVSSGGEGAAVLIRALEPLAGLDTMLNSRAKNKKSTMKNKELCNGPSKLCQALHISKVFDLVDLVGNEEFYIAQDNVAVSEEDIVEKARVGIAYAEEWTEKPLRYYIKDNPCVSVK